MFTGCRSRQVSLGPSGHSPPTRVDHWVQDGTLAQGSGEAEVAQAGHDEAGPREVRRLAQQRGQAGDHLVVHHEAATLLRAAVVVERQQ